MAIAASLRLLRRMHSPSCTYSPRRRDSTNFLVLKEGAHVSPSQSIIIGLIRNGRGDPVWVRGALCTELEYGVRTVYSAQCIVLSIIVTDTALPPPEVSGLEKRATRPHKEKKKKIVISCQLSDVFQPVDYLLISMHQWYCKSDMFAGALLPEDSPQKTVMHRRQKSIIASYHVPPPLSCFPALTCLDVFRKGDHTVLCATIPVINGWTDHHAESEINQMLSFDWREVCS